MDFEDIIDQLGSFGHWQRVIFFLICLPDVFGAFAMMIPVFVGATPRWRCNSYESANDTIDAVNIPNGTDLMQCSYKTIYSCTNFTFVDDFTSIVSEWTLVCDRRYVSDMITTIQMVGLMVGAAFFGHFSDICGRRKPYFIAFTVIIVAGFLSAFSPAVEMFAACRFFVGVGYGAQMVINCVYPLEFVGHQHRVLCGTVGFWAIGCMLLALCGFAVRQWNYLLITTSASGVVYYITLLLIPESPRWLALRSRYHEAEMILLKIAKKNKINPPDLSILKEFAIKTKAEEAKLTKYTYLDLFRIRKFCRLSLIIFTQWFTLFIMYYLLALNMKHLSGNRYMNMFLAGLVDLAVMLLVIPLSNTIGRRFTQLMFLLTCIVADVVIISLIETGTGGMWPHSIMVTSLVGKACALGSTYVIQIWTAELYPTAIRNKGVGLGSVAGRIGTTLAPQMVYLGTYYELAPHIITVILCVVCVPLLFLLKETRGQPLDDVFDPHRKNNVVQDGTTQNKTCLRLDELDVCAADTDDGNLKPLFQPQSDLPLEFIATCAS